MQVEVPVWRIVPQTHFILADINTGDCQFARFIVFLEVFRSSETMAEGFQIRDYYNAKVITAFATDLKKVWTAFPTTAFLHHILPSLPDQSFSDRLQSISRALEKTLPQDFQEAVGILLKALPEPMPVSGDGAGTAHFIIAPQTAFISRCGQGHVEVSLHALKEMTRRFTAEWDLRLFFEKDPVRVRKVLKKWARDPDQHVRRLVSEGTRPYVPWGKKLAIVEADPSLTLDLLDLLKHDQEEYVRRSVANHLNDLSKKHPDLVVSTLTRWQLESPEVDMAKFTRHACRTLVKKGHRGALKLLGFDPRPKVELRHFTLASPVVQLGDALAFSFELESTSRRDQQLVVDFLVYFRKANGSLSPKVFKLKNVLLAAGSCLAIEKKHAIRPITTRVYYPGEHRLSIQVNGVELGSKTFKLEME